MRYWTNVCVEGHCLGEDDENGNCPCGRSMPSPFCLGPGGIKHCPHFAWSDTTERNVAHFVPFRLIFWDRLKIFVTETTYWKLRWWFWDCLWFNQRKTREFFDNIKVVTAENSPAVARWEKEKQKSAKEFDKWFPKAKKEW